NRKEEKYKQSAGKKDRYRPNETAEYLHFPTHVAQSHSSRKGGNRECRSRNRSYDSHSCEHVLPFYCNYVWVLIPDRIRSHTELLIHDWHQHLSTTKYDASHTIGILKKIDRLSIGPVILPCCFTHDTRENEDYSEEPEVPPSYSPRFLFHLRNT